MQTNSTSKDQSNETKSNTKLNVNAPVFEPKNQKINSNTDPIWSKFPVHGNIKSTMLVSPQSQQFINPALSCNLSPYTAIYSYPNQYQIKIDHAVSRNGASAIYTMDPNVLPSQAQTSGDLCTIINNSTISLSSSNDQKELSSISQISTAHSDTDCPPHIQPLTQPFGIEVNQPLLLHQNNQSPIMWQTCPQSPIALFPNYLSGPRGVYVIHPQQLIVNPYVVSQNKSASKVYIKNKTFNTGDPELDRLLNELVKRINPGDEFVFRSTNSRFFVIKSFTEDNIYQSIRHSVWCSTPAGNETLVQAYKQVKSREVPNDETTRPHVYLFFSVNGSGYFCGVAEMTSELHPANSLTIWNQKKWQNQFSVNWLYIKDVPNSYLRQIKLESNENRPVTNCRDATEILPIEKGIEVLKIIHNIHYDTCLLNDFNENIRTDKPLN